MLELVGEFGRVQLGGGPSGSGVYWVDDDGHWNKFDPLLPDSFTNQNFDASVRNRKIAYGLMGMVRVEISEVRKHVDISWNVRRANNVTLDSVSNYLEMICVGHSVTLNYCIDAWHYEWIRDPIKAADRMQRSKSFQYLPIIDKVFMKQIAFDWDANSTSLIKRGVQAFEKSKGNLIHSDLNSQLPLFIVYKPCEYTNQMTIVNAGVDSAYASIYGRSWSAMATGSGYDSKTPGEYFSTRVSEAYHDVLSSGDPRLGHIRGIVKRPNEESIWSSYQRFLFRGRWHDGSPVLVCLSDLTQNLDIPFFVDNRHIN